MSDAGGLPTRRLLAVTATDVLDRMDHAEAMAGVSACVRDGVVLLTTPCGPDPRTAARRDHDRVTALWRAGATLPGGVGGVFDPAGPAPKDWLIANLGSAQTALTRVAGKGEYVVSLRLVGAASPAKAGVAHGAGAGGGAAYLKARAAEMQASDAEAEILEGAINLLRETFAGLVSGAIVSPTAPSPVGGTRSALDVSLLAPTEAGSELAAALDARRSELDRGVEADLSGPWPPYSFAAAWLSPAGALGDQAPKTEERAA